MAELNRVICAADANANTGFGDCVLTFGTVRGAFLVSPNLKLDAAQLANLQTTLTNLANADSPSERIYPIHQFLQITDATEDKSITTLGYGGKYPAREGDYDWTFQFMNGGMCLLKALQTFNGSGKHVIFYDENGMLFGTMTGNETDGFTLSGIPLIFFWSNKWRPSDGTAITNYSVQFVFQPQHINQNLGFVQADFDPATIVGMQNINLRRAAGTAMPVLKITAATGCSAADLYPVFGSELADEALWLASQTGGPVAITSVAEDTALGGWTVTLDSDSANYSASQPVKLSLAAPSVLKAAGIEGFESKVVTITP